uniref:Acetyl-coenzyme A carboxylase carboxyl transferase subunit beta, chloroplastic n=1 Tax=Pouzolzia hirta TaxID=648870 RepID=A0A6B9TSR4_9ROSA|nr:acetyl-CoA carboxylase carboxyltransferase beta subunit [Pouzolzia hirta]QHN53253.1 acetyl-CoA carboxylase carboxyltransferase beta subunit [Pouzolzia hirta]QQQ88103.1 acetyl-CoA carboxylase carboxyltransferase beta subunit [Pouzolzia hirta]
MEKWRFNSMFFSGVLEYRCGLNKAIKSLGDPIDENTSLNEDPIINDMDKYIHSGNKSDNSSYSNVHRLSGVIRNFISDENLLVMDSNRESYFIDFYFDIEKEIFDIDAIYYFISEPANYFYSYWKNHINSCIDSYFGYQIRIDSYILTNIENDNDSYFYSYICGERENSNEERENSNEERENSNESESSSIRISTDDSDLTITESSNDLDDTQKYKHLWVQCENCYGLNYKKFFKSKMNICEHCGCHLKMSSSDRIELLIDPGTWDPMDEDMVSLDPIEFHLEEEPYKDRIDSYQKKTGLTEAVQTGTGKLNGIPVAIGVMDFQFMGGSMGSVVGEKITRLIEYAAKEFLPLILVCASGGARMQEGSLSLMQMAKISSALYNYQLNYKLVYVAILTSPTTGGVTASFGMLGDIIIAEPDAYIAFAGKRVIEQTLNKTVPEGSQVAEYLFDKGLFDPIVPRNPLKSVLSELFQFHYFFALKENSIQVEMSNT